MLCCVVAGALFALAMAKLRRVPIIGGYIKVRELEQSDASNWRLGSKQQSKGEIL